MINVALDTSHYNPPSVYTQGVPGPQVGINPIAPAAVAIFGNTIGYRTDTQTVVIPADSGGVAVATPPLRQMGISTSSIVVRDLITNNLYNLTTDYTITSINGPSGVPNGPDSTVTLKRVLSGNLAALTSVQVSFNYTNAQYFLPTIFYSYNDVRDAYGAAMDSNGNITSELTLACYFAFLNGASQIIGVAVQPTSNPPSLSDYQNALNQLQAQNNVTVIVPATGNQALFAAVQSHVDTQSNNAHERRAILGRDGSVTAVPSATRISNAQAINDSRIALISPATVNYYNPTTNAIQVLGSQFLAAAVAGINSTQPPSMPLTRKTISGFVNIAESLSESQKNFESQNGLMVLENTNQGTVRIRHGVTTAPATLISREWTITGQSDAMVYQLRGFLDNDGLIGGIIDNLTLPLVKASASAALENLVNNNILHGYDNLAVRQLITSPDIIQITFEWQPSIPLNYILVSYSINTTTGNITQATTSNTNV